MNLGSVAGSQHGFGLAITVPVVGYDILLVILEVGHVGSPVYPPEFLTVQLIDLHDEVLAIVACFLIGSTGPTAVVELQQDFQFSVTIHISTTGIIGYVCRFQGTMIRSYLEILLRPWCHGVTLFLWYASHHGLHLITARSTSAVIGIIGNRQRFSVKFCAVTVDIVSHVIILLTEDTPCAEHATAGLHGHQTAIQLIHRALSMNRQYHGEHQYCRQ